MEKYFAEKSMKNLREYIEEDMIFNNPPEEMSDFDQFCYNHCKDIENVLKYLKELGLGGK